MPQVDQNPMHDLNNLDSPTIKIINHHYSPDELTAKEGAVIKIVNNDPDEHTVTDENDEFDIEVEAGSQTELVTPERGEYSYYCRYHPEMKGKLFVK